MSTEQDKVKHSKRIHNKQTRTHRQSTLSKQIFKEVVKEPHVYHKRSFATCGNSNCVMCMNPRKATGELTIQEQRLFQDGLHESVEHNDALYED